MHAGINAYKNSVLTVFSLLLPQEVGISNTHDDTDDSASEDSDADADRFSVEFEVESIDSDTYSERDEASVSDEDEVSNCTSPPHTLVAAPSKASSYHTHTVSVIQHSCLDVSLLIPGLVLPRPFSLRLFIPLCVSCSHWKSLYLSLSSGLSQVRSCSLSAAFSISYHNPINTIYNSRNETTVERSSNKMCSVYYLSFASHNPCESLVTLCQEVQEALSHSPSISLFPSPLSHCLGLRGHHF